MRMFFSLLTTLLAISAAQMGAAEEREGQITVIGQGLFNVVPYMALVRIGVVHQSETAGEAMSGMAESLDGVLARISALGVEAADTQTSDLNLYPLQDRASSNGTPKITGYTA